MIFKMLPTHYHTLLFLAFKEVVFVEIEIVLTKERIPKNNIANIH